MKKYIILNLVLFASFACSKQENNDALVETQGHIRTVEALLDDSLTKADYGEVDASDPEHKKISFLWQNGDKVGIYVIKGDVNALLEGTVAVSEGTATISFDDTDVTGISAVWYPYKADQSVDLDAIPASQDYTTAHVWIPLKATPALEDASWTFSAYLNYSVVRYRLTKGNANRKIISIKAHDYTLENVNVDLTGTEQYFHVVCPSGETIGNFETTFTTKDDEGKTIVYKRTKASYTPVEGKVTAFPATSDLDETGKALWTFGKKRSSTNSELVYWGQWHNESNLARVSNDTKDEYATVTTVGVTNGGMTKFRANIGPINNYNHSSDGVNVANNQVPLEVHPGNYPIFAVKMTNPKLLGDSRNFCLVVSDTDGNFDGKKLNNSDNTQNYMEPYNADLKGPVVMYYDFSTEKIGNQEDPLKNTVKTLLKRLVIQFADIKYSSAQSTNPTFEICWAGFFNSLDELRNYDKIGFYADRMDADAALWTKGHNGTVLSIEESNGEKYVNVVPQNNTNNGRGDIIRSSPVILSRDYPILAFRMDDVNDRDDETETGGNFTRNIIIDTNGLGSDGNTYKGELGGNKSSGRNAWNKKYSCADGSSVFVYDLSTQPFGSSADNVLPEDVIVTLSTFQIKYADIKNSDGSNIKDINNLAYRFFWFHTFQSMPDLTTYLKDRNITYSE